MNKHLIKTIDAAVMPATVMICGKVFGLWFANLIFKLDWGLINDSNSFFSVRVVNGTQEQLITATSYSNLIMFLFVFIGFMITISKALLFSSTKVSPSIIAKLATSNLLNIIIDYKDAYRNSFIWLVFVWLSLLVIFVNTMLGRTFLWSSILSFTFALFMTVIILQDVSKEIKIAKKISKSKSTPNLMEISREKII